MTVDVRTLFTSKTADEIMADGLALATSEGLSVTTWRVGDPSRTLLKFVAQVLAARDLEGSEFNRAGFLSSARGLWKTLVAAEVYGVTRQAATYSTPSITLANGGGGAYDFDAGEAIFKSSSSGVLFHSTQALSLASGPGTTATIALVADEPGSDGTVGVDDVDTIVTTMLGVTVSSSTAAVGMDEQSDAGLDEQCLATLGSLSVNGPPDAYVAVALNSELTGTSAVTRAWSSEDDPTGAVTVWVAGPSGGVGGTVVTLVETAIELWATPCCITPTVVDATTAAQTVAYTIDGTDLPASAEDDIETLVATYFAVVRVSGLVSRSALIALAHDYLVGAGAGSVTVALTTPAADVQLSAGQVPTVGSVTVVEA